MDAGRVRTVIFDAEPFCFGPISTTLNVARALRKLSPVPLRLLLMGTLTSSQLALESQVMDEVIECDTSSSDALTKHASLLESAAVYVSNTNFRSVDTLKAIESGVRIALIDTLFWMWDELPDALKKADALYLQNFFGVERRARELDRAEHRNVKIVPPLVHLVATSTSPAPLSRPASIVVNLGGIENIYVRDKYYAEELVAEVLAAIGSVAGFDNVSVTVCGGGKEIARVRERFNGSRRNLDIGCFAQDHYLAALQACSHFMTLPGLTSFCEAALRGKNTFFLLPQNYSQFLQLELIRLHSSQAQGMNWTDFAGFPVPAAMEPELTGVNKVRSCNAMFFASPLGTERFREAIRVFLCRREPSVPAPPSFLLNEQSGPEQVASSLLEEFVLRE